MTSMKGLAVEIDVRGPQFAAAITCAVLVGAYVLQSTVLLAFQVLVFAVATFAGPKWSPYGYLFRSVKRVRRWGPPTVTEPAAGVRFSQLMGFLFTGAGVVAIASGARVLGWALVLVVIALSGLLAATGLCVGCEVYAISKRVLGRGLGRDIGGTR